MSRHRALPWLPLKRGALNLIVGIPSDYNAYVDARRCSMDDDDSWLALEACICVLQWPTDAGTRKASCQHDAASTCSCIYLTEASGRLAEPAAAQRSSTGLAAVLCAGGQRSGPSAGGHLRAKPVDVLQKPSGRSVRNIRAWPEAGSRS